MLNLIYKSFIKKQVGGFEIMDGIVLGPGYFSNNGEQSSVLICPPIWAFNYGMSNTFNRIDNTEDSKDEFQSCFSSILDDIIAEILIYLENRLKLIVVKNKLKKKMNSIPECVKAYKVLADIDLNNFCNIPFLKKIDRIRGDKHHSHRRYDSNYKIGDENYDNIDKIKNLIITVKEEVQDLDKKLSIDYLDYEVKKERLPKAIKVEWKAKKHAIDMTKGGKIVEQLPTKGLDKSQIKYFSVQFNYDK